LKSFRTTVWTVVRRAGEDSESAVNEIVGRYRPPVERWFRHRVGDLHLAEDLSQEVFKRLFVDKVIAKADPNMGRFRGLVVGVARRVLSEDTRRRSALKRQALPAMKPEQQDEFDKLWVEHLVGLAVKLLEARSAKSKVNYAKVLDLTVRDGLSPSQIAARFKVAEGVARNWVHRARRFIAAEIKRLVHDYSASPDDYETEVRYLSKYLG
jgi:RNA polymerase sigma factor (sigma-70 family)